MNMKKFNFFNFPFAGKKIIIALVCVVVLFLAGCDDTGTVSTTKTYIGGTDSIEFDFMEESPPVEVYDSGNQPFDVTVKLENDGEYDVAKEDITVTLSGFYPLDFNNPVLSKNPDEDLDKSYKDPDGDIEDGTITYVNFPDLNFVGKITGTNEYTIRADVCYKYGTKAQVDLCILDDLTSTEEDEVCDPSETKSVASSSAPVQVEDFKEEISGTRKVTFSFDIVHRESGLVSKLGSGCDDEIGIKNKVMIDVDSELSGLKCTGLEGGSDTSGYVSLYGGKRTVRCTQDLSGVSGDFEKKVHINLKYDYKEHKDFNLVVKHTT